MAVLYFHVLFLKFLGVLQNFRRTKLVNACQQVDNQKIRNRRIDNLKDATIMTAHRFTDTGLTPIDPNTPVGPLEVSASDID